MFDKLTSEEKDKCLSRIESITNSKKLFLIKDISLADLSKETGITVHKISYLINSERRMNFNDYINLKRIHYLIENMHDPTLKGLSISQLAIICGFGCRASLFRAFCKHKGISPLDYLKRRSDL